MLLVLLKKKTVWFHFNSPQKIFPYGINTQSELDALYKTPVVSATRYERFEISVHASLEAVNNHYGVAVTLADSSTYLIYKVIVTTFSWVVIYYFITHMLFTWFLSEVLVLVIILVIFTSTVIYLSVPSDWVSLI